MEPLFENTTVRTEKLDKEFCRYIKDINSYAVAIFAALVLLGFIGYCAVKALLGTPSMGWLCLIFGVVLVLCMGYFFLQDSRTYKRSRKQTEKFFGTADLCNRVSFFENEYRLTCEQTNADVSVRYSDIAKITLTPSLLLLTRYNKATTILDREGFTGKAEEEAFSFLLDACPGAKFKDHT